MVTNTIDIIVTMETPACKHSPGLDHNASKYTVNPTGGQSPVYTAIPHSLPSYKVSPYLRSTLVYQTGNKISFFLFFYRDNSPLRFPFHRSIFILTSAGADCHFKFS